jgi:hypothetical protein
MNNSMASRRKKLIYPSDVLNYDSYEDFWDELWEEDDDEEYDDEEDEEESGDVKW